MPSILYQSNRGLPKAARPVWLRPGLGGTWAVKTSEVKTWAVKTWVVKTSEVKTWAVKTWVVKTWAVKT
jgi:hypothetical protein